MRLVLFTSSRCQVCVPLKEKLRELSKRLNLELKEISIEGNPQEAAQRLVFSAPTVILEEGGREINRWSGVFSVTQVEEFINRLLTE
ncbi:thioredoxin family protein [Thermovibrio sp.]